MIDTSELVNNLVASLRDIGWNVEPEAYDDYQLPASVLSGRVSTRVTASASVRGLSLDGDVLLPTMMILRGGRVVKLDSLSRPQFR